MVAWTGSSEQSLWCKAAYKITLSEDYFSLRREKTEGEEKVQSESSALPGGVLLAPPQAI